MSKNLAKLIMKWTLNREIGLTQSYADSFMERANYLNKNLLLNIIIGLMQIYRV